MQKSSNYILLLVSIIIAALIAEVFLRIFFPEIGWAQRKESVIGWSSDEYKRFDPNQGPKNSTEKRILFLGDSFLAGSGVSDLDKRFPVLLESLLNQKVSCEILAAGGWGTDQQLLAFKQKGRLWSPDLVFLAFCANNDISNILSHHHGPKALKPYFVIGKHNTLDLFDEYGMPMNYETFFRADYEWEEEKNSFARIYLIDFIRHILLSRFSTYRFNYNSSFQTVDDRYRTFRFWEEEHEAIYKRRNKLSWSPQNSVNHVSAYIHDNFEMNTYQWKLFEYILIKLNNEVENSGGKLVVMLLPVIFNPEDPETIAGGSFAKRFQTPTESFLYRSVEPRERLKAISERVGVMFFDPTQDFINYVTNENLMQAVWPNSNDRHFSELGHEKLAKLCMDYIKVIMKKDKKNAEQSIASDR